MSSSNYVRLDVDEVVRETDKAFLLRIDKENEVWVPLSQIAHSDQYMAGDRNCTISVTSWFAEKRGLV